MTILWILFPLMYLAICGGLLEQVNSMREISRARRFVIAVPLLHIYFLGKTILLYLITRNEKYKNKMKCYFPYKTTLIIILFSISQVEKEIADEKKKHRSRYKQISVRDWFESTDKEISDNLTEQCI